MHTPQKKIANIPVWAWAAILIGDFIIFIFVVLYLYNPAGFKRFFAQHLPEIGTLGIGAAALATAAGFFWANRGSRRALPGAFAPFGIALQRKWGTEGSLGRISLFGSGPYLEGRWRGSRLACSEIFDESLYKLTIFHARPLFLGLYCARNWRGAARDAHEFRPLNAERVPVDGIDLECRAADAGTARKLLGEDRPRAALEALVAMLGTIPDAGLILTDMSLSVKLPAAACRTDILEAMHAVSFALTSSRLLPITPPPKKLSERVFQSVVIVLLFAVIIAVIVEIASRTR